LRLAVTEERLVATCSSHAREQARVVSFAALSLLPPKQARAHGALRVSLLVRCSG
jgi:hypothetical protein